MSHYSVYKVSLGNITVDLLRQAITSLAKEIGANVVDSIRDWRGVCHKVVVGLVSPNLPFGIGFNIDGGNLVIEGDPYKQEDFYRVAKLAPSYVKAYKVAQNAKVLNPNAKMRLGIKQTNVVLEVVV
ncbi:MAG: hypothetical protein NZ932_04115 [Candidatus Bathyarchaeota archaeon]|nr:hypothetical protein [Candidatus Bathyarchaeota archaeon]MDW8022345.1 hypothetical protein [Nitrososphaerota archaeon]